MAQSDPMIIRLRGEQNLLPLMPDIDRPTVIDLSGVPFASSRLLQSLVEDKEQAIIAAPSPGVQNSLKVSGLDKILAISETVDEAIERARKRIEESLKRSTKSFNSYERSQKSIQRSLEMIQKATEAGEP